MMMADAGPARPPIPDPQSRVERRAQQVEWLTRWSRQLDSRFPIPGTRFRFGWDPIIGLVPGAGEVVSASFGAVVLFRALQFGVPRVIVLRMVLNVLIDLAVGAVPVAGDLFDFAWKSNDMNLALLVRHARPGTEPTSADWAFVMAIVVAVGSAAMLVALTFGWAGYRLAQLVMP